MRTSKVTKERVIGGQQNRHKSFIRKELLSIISNRLSGVVKPTAHTLCGPNAIFENALIAKRRFNIKCYENNLDNYKAAIKTLPSSASLTYGDWTHHLAEPVPDFAWADFCASAGDDLLVLTAKLDLQRHIASKKKFVYAVTFSSPRKSGGMGTRRESLMKLSGEKKKCEIRTSSELASVLARYFYKVTGRCPAKAVYYPGGKTGRTHMVTLVWTDEKKFAPMRWQCTSPLGCRNSVFIDRHKDKESKKKPSMIKGWEKLTPGKKAWATRLYNQRCAPAKKAWITRRRNERMRKALAT